MKSSPTSSVSGDASRAKEMRAMENDIDQLERKLQAKHIQRLGKGKCSAHAGVYFSDIVSVLERVSDHAMNIAFSVLEAKGIAVK